jgi:hypothetical protein
MHRVILYSPSGEIDKRFIYNCSDFEAANQRACKLFTQLSKYPLETMGMVIAIEDEGKEVLRMEIEA